jgi:hypothetical protein
MSVATSDTGIHVCAFFVFSSQTAELEFYNNLWGAGTE